MLLEISEKLYYIFVSCLVVQATLVAWMFSTDGSLVWTSKLNLGCRNDGTFFFGFGQTMESKIHLSFLSIGINNNLWKNEIRMKFSSWISGPSSSGLPAPGFQRSASRGAAAHGGLDHPEREEEHHRQAGGRRTQEVCRWSQGTLHCLSRKKERLKKLFYDRLRFQGVGASRDGV